MNKNSTSSIFLGISLGLVLILAFLNRELLTNYYAALQRQYFPCTSPITYSIGNFDTRFDISREDFLSLLKEAEQIWEMDCSECLQAYP